MTCVRQGSLVEMTTDGGDVWVQAVETLGPGDRVRDPLTGRAVTVVTTLVHETGGIWPLVQYLGLTADFAQFVPVADRWVAAGDVGTRSMQLCPCIYAIVVSDGKTACVDGVTCCVHTPTDLASADTATPVGPRFWT